MDRFYYITYCSCCARCHPACTLTMCVPVSVYEDFQTTINSERHKGVFLEKSKYASSPPNNVATPTHVFPLSPKLEYVFFLQIFRKPSGYSLVTLDLRFGPEYRHRGSRERLFRWIYCFFVEDTKASAGNTTSKTSRPTEFASLQGLHKFHGTNRSRS